MDDKPLILPIEAWRWDWTRSFPYPFDVITAGTVAILATAMAIISRDAAEISRRIFTSSRLLCPLDSFNLLQFPSLVSRVLDPADAWIFDQVQRGSANLRSEVTKLVAKFSDSKPPLKSKSDFSFFLFFFFFFFFVLARGTHVWFYKSGDSFVIDEVSTRPPNRTKSDSNWFCDCERSNRGDKCSGKLWVTVWDECRFYLENCNTESIAKWVWFYRRNCGLWKLWLFSEVRMVLSVWLIWCNYGQRWSSIFWEYMEFIGARNWLHLTRGA